MGKGKVKIGEYAFSASQVGTLFGCGYKSLYEMYEQYKGIATEENVTEEAKKSMEFGTFFEDTVAKWYADKYNCKIRRCGETAYWADDMPYFICHPDRLVTGKDEKGRRVALEIKCVNPSAKDWGEDGTEDIPDKYYFQVQSYFACQVPCDVVKVVCMRGNRIFVYEIQKDEDVVAEIRRRVKQTKEDWDNGIEPDTQGYDEAVRQYSRKVKFEEGQIGAGDDVMNLWNQISKLHQIENDAKDQQEAIKVKLIKALGDNQAFVATIDGKVKKIVQWSSTTRNSFDKEAFSKDYPKINLDNYNRRKTTPYIKVNYDTPKKEKENK